jgi:hypothetical protein
LAGALATALMLIITAIVKRQLPSRVETAEAKVDEATADATASGAWQKFAAVLQADMDVMRGRMQADVDSMRGRITSLESEVAALRSSLHEADKRVQLQAVRLQSVTRWALLLRDEVIRLGGDIPPPPPEIEDALTNLSP